MTSIPDKTELTGLVFDIQRLSTHDGPGFRTAIFLKGCPLTCGWCHNPEGISPEAQVWWNREKCINCLECFEACNYAALIDGNGGISINRDKCTGCGECVDSCSAGAMEKIGHIWTVERLVKEILRDSTFFKNSGGGVTMTGGEPANQAPFIIAVFKKLQEMGIHTAIDTCGQALPETVIELARHSDLVIYDLPEMNTERHLEYRGVDNSRIIDNLMLLAGTIRQWLLGGGKAPRLWVRTPLIPGATARAGNIRRIAGFIKEELDDVVEQWEMNAFNPTCSDKYRRLALDWEYANTSLLASSDAARLMATAVDAGMPASRVRLTGVTAGGSSEERHL